MPPQARSPPQLIPDGCGFLPGSFGRCPSARKNPVSCQTPGLYGWPRDKPNRLASRTPALSHCLIIVAVVAALVSLLGLSTLMVFATFSCWHGWGRPGSPDLSSRGPWGRRRLWLGSLAHLPGTSLTRLAADSPNTSCLISSPGPLPPPPKSSLLLPPPPLPHFGVPPLYLDGTVIEIKEHIFRHRTVRVWEEVFPGCALGYSYFNSIRRLFIGHRAVVAGHCHPGLPGCGQPAGSG